jgi:hypothetical protein
LSAVPNQLDNDGTPNISFDPSSKPTIVDSQIISNPPSELQISGDSNIEGNRVENI